MVVAEEFIKPLNIRFGGDIAAMIKAIEDLYPNWYDSVCMLEMLDELRAYQTYQRITFIDDILKDLE